MKQLMCGHGGQVDFAGIIGNVQPLVVLRHFREEIQSLIVDGNGRSAL